MIKSLFITTEFPPGPGGIGMHAYHVIDQLQKQYNIHFKIILTHNYNSNDSEFNKFKQEYEFDLNELMVAPSLPKLIRNLFNIIYHTLKYRPDIIITSGKHATWYGAFVKLLLRKKVIAFIHGSELGTKIKKEQKINQLSYSYVDKLISVSNYTLNYLETETSIKPKSSEVIHNGGDHTTFYKLDYKAIQEFKNKYDLQGKNIILTLGNVSKRKGQWVVIKSMQKILHQLPDTHYYMIGNPSEKNNLDKLSKQLGITKNIHFLGRLTNHEINSWLNATDIFAMTSTHTNDGDFEGFGISVIEAALCGVPAVVTNNNNGVIESIEEGYSGISIDEGDFNILSEKIISLLKDKETLNKLGENALNRAKQKFTWAVKAEEIHLKIKEVIK